MEDQADKRPKIFGLGLSKTGTSSLGEALNLLGIKTIHYPFDDGTYEELRRGDYRLSILREYQAVVDIPVAPYYAQLDRVFPGSKFILTVRDAEAWLRSIELHWKLLMQWWDNIPRFRRFQEFISASVYGSIDFNRDRFLYAYETHRKNVLDYFRDRPGDLLVMEICDGEGWDRLCRFLELPRPDVPFPHANEWMHKLLEATHELRQLIAPGETFILADLQGFGEDFSAGRRALPFLEKDGGYWGLPPDDDTAIREFGRLRSSGAAYMVLGWPAFWWLDHYLVFTTYLRDHFPCILDNDRLIIFKLR